MKSFTLFPHFPFIRVRRSDGSRLTQSHLTSIFLVLHGETCKRQKRQTNYDDGQLQSPRPEGKPRRREPETTQVGSVRVDRP